MSDRLFLCLFSFLLSSVTPTYHVAAQASRKAPQAPAIRNVYRVPMGVEQGKKVWIVDGLVVRRELFGEFLYGGNGERYPFCPANEIWIDHAISAEEYRYTLAHELRERDLMARRGLTYAEGHDSALALERTMRLADKEEASRHEAALHLVSPAECDGIKEIAGLPDSIPLKQIYRQYLGRRDGIDVWIVDGAAVRREIFPDFGLSGSDLAYRFIPTREIWIDGQISCEETEFSIAAELKERQSITSGKSYDDAYEEALRIVRDLRNDSRRQAGKHAPIITPRIRIKDQGTGKEAK